MAGHRIVLAGTLFLSGALALAGEGIPNWPAPASWTPRGASVIRPLSTLSDVGGPLPFIPITPCRIADTRGNGFTAQAGPPSLTGGAPRNFQIGGTVPGVPAQCGIPSLAAAVSLNITVTNTLGPGFISIYPQGGPAPLVSTLNYVAGQTIANAAVVPLGSGGITVVAGVSGTDLIIDTNGYYSQEAASETPLVISVDSGIAIEGVARGTAGVNFGVVGSTSSAALQGAGVYGWEGGQPANPGNFFPSGVRGEGGSNISNGVLGISRFSGVAGDLVNTSGAELAYGILGFNNGTVWGVYAGGNIGATGTKPFLEVHPTDANKQIRHVALEGPEAGTYFRGTDETSHGMAVIQVPESFRQVTDAEGLTVQLTPIGAPATMYVVSQDLNQIVVRSSRDVKFHYLVNGVRQTFKDWRVVVDEGFMPDSPQQKLPAYFSEAQKQRLISNGTYNADGTVNMATAERVGWTRVWTEREAQRQAAAQEARKTMEAGRP